MAEQLRRRILKTVPVVTGAIISAKAQPDFWTRPIVNAVVLPAHAVTTYANNATTPQATTTEQCIELLQTPVGTIVIPCRNNPAR